MADHEECIVEIEHLKSNVKELDEGLTTVKRRLDDLEHRHSQHCSIEPKLEVKVAATQISSPVQSSPPPQAPPKPAEVKKEPKAVDVKREVIEVRRLHLDNGGTYEWTVDHSAEAAEAEIVQGAPSRPVDFAPLDVNEILAAANLNEGSGKNRFATPPKDGRIEISEQTTVENGHTISTKRVLVTTERVTNVTHVSPLSNAPPTLNGTRNGEHAPRVQVIGLKKNKGDNHLVSTAYCARVSHVSSDPVIAFLLQGLTVRQENGQLIIDGIKDESPVARQGLLHVGDSILEVNGVEVKTPDELHAQLSNIEGVALKVVPSGLESAPVINGDYIRCCFDYDPLHDEQIPSKSIGLAFKVGEILQIINKDDPDWWQARKVNDWSYVGLIPSQTLEERRKAAAAGIAPTTVAGQVLDSAQKKAKKIMYNVKNNADFDEHDILCYEQVGKMSPYGRRVLVLLGAPGVGRRTLKARLLQHDPDNFATITPFTSRKARDNEQEGREYHFTSREKMQKEIDQGEFLEWGEFNNNFYGTKTDSVRKIIRSGRVCVLDCSPQAIKYLYNSEFMPYICFIAPPPFEEFKQLYQVHPSRTKPKSDEDMKRICDEAIVMEGSYKHVFDHVLINRNAEVTFRRLYDALESLKTQPQWVPVSWLYS